MMATVCAVSGALEDGERRGAISGGDLLVFEKVSPMVELCAYADVLIRKAFDTDDPVGAQFGLGRTSTSPG